MRTVVCDTGPILHLVEADALSLLRHVAPILIPPIVETEILSLLPNWRIDQPAWIRLRHLSARYSAESKEWFSAGLLDPGEAEAISLSRQVSATWFLSDDAAATLFAQSLGVEVHGSLGVVLWCVAKGFLTEPDGRMVLHRLKQSSLWLSARVMQEALAALSHLGSKG